MDLTPTEKLLINLLEIPSVSGQETALAEFLVEQLSVSFEVERLPVGEGRFNVLAKSGSPKTLLVAHIDTVVGELEIKVEPDRICGRGSCDNKGSAAAMITAGLKTLAANQTDFGLLFTVGEETDCDGAVAAVEFLKKNRLTPESVVIGEPTGLQIATAQKGILAATISCVGTRAHSSLSECDSATEKLTRLLNQLIEMCPAGTSFNIGKLIGGEADNIVADQAEARVSWRSSDPAIKSKIERIIAVSNIDCQVDFKLDLPPVDRTRPDFSKNEVAFFSEMFFFENSLLCGPGDIRNAHTEHEFVLRTELNAAVETYVAFINQSKSV
ncbi:M20/M25/M40 family metallo-hydrolase [Patescibacteria group bacterium]|nr:M20/M25/M40 family metallo-hydrolase [Patescibacteria group bacterium]MBU1029183.1 M20/M25/M40 family metallo-hydrolase [Patescibacteria group bacterium]MBU1916292.1 M20/M25/M40 family metallo-hydrolase [Patescibacteria group bacterium]